MRQNDLDELAIVLLVFKRAVEQRFGVAAYGRERRSKLMRNVGYEILTYLFLMLEVGDVVQHDDGAALGLGTQRQCARLKPPAGGGRQLKAILFGCTGLEN